MVVGHRDACRRDERGPSASRGCQPRFEGAADKGARKQRASSSCHLSILILSFSSHLGLFPLPALSWYPRGGAGLAGLARREPFLQKHRKCYYYPSLLLKRERGHCPCNERKPGVSLQGKLNPPARITTSHSPGQHLSCLGIPLECCWPSGEGAQMLQQGLG